MVEQALGSSSGISPQAGPVAVENHTTSDINMRRAAQVIGRRLALIGDELDNRWKEKLPYPRHLNLQVHHNMLIWRAMNRRIVGTVFWSNFVPMMKAKWVVPQLHNQACQATMKWITWVKHSILDLSCGTKCFLASAVPLVATAVFAAVWKTNES